MSSGNQNRYQTLLGSPRDDQLASAELEPDTTVLWSSGLCDCCADPKLCCLTCWCPCITFGRIAEAVDHGKTSCVASAGIHALLTYMTGFGWMYSYIYRSKMRKQYTGVSSHFKDCLAHFCCETCALCQEYRELQLRGSTGDEQKKYGVEAVPVIPGGMIR